MATPVSGKASYSQSKTEQAKSGDIKTGMMYNVSSVGSIGTVKLLALSGLAWIVFKFLEKK